MTTDSEKVARIKVATSEFARTRTPESFKPGFWSVSHLNFADEARTEIPALPTRVRLCDITLSRFEQTAGIALSPDEMDEVLIALDELGVPMLDVSLWYHRRDSETLKRWQGLTTQAELVVHVGYSKELSFDEQLDAAAEIGLSYVTITTGPSHHWERAYRGNEIGDTESEVIANRVSLVERAKERGLKVRATFQYPTYLSDVGFLARVSEAQAEAGADLLLLADHGGLSPTAVKYLVSVVRANAPLTPIGIHYHDSLGLAMACSLAAVEAGAEVVEVTINGVGAEGHADLAQAAVALEALYGLPTGLRLEKLESLYRVFAERSGFEVWPYKPVVGENFFELSSDRVSRASMFDHDPYISTTMLPEAIGGTTRLEFGMQSGPLLLARKADELGIELDDEAVTAIIDGVHAEIASTKARISDTRLLELIGEVAGSKATVRS